MKKKICGFIKPNRDCKLDIRTVSWAYLPNNILKHVILRLLPQPKNLIIKDASPTALDDGTLLDCHASLAKTDNTTADQGERDCKLGFQPNNTTPSSRERLASRDWSRRRNRQAVGGTNEPTRKPSNASKSRQRAGVRVNPVKARAAFTLAEVLIVIAVIGVVAALTIPALITHFDTIVNKNRKEVIEDRLLEGMNQLNTLDAGFEASQYEDTEGFVRALSKYYKMSQICGAEDMKKCFPYATIKYTDEEGEVEANVEDLKTPEAFKLSSDEWFAPASFISAQGTPFVMLLKKNCTRDTEELFFKSSRG